MSKLKKLIIFLVIIIILFIVAIALILISKKPSKLKNIYNKISNGQDFTFSMEEQSDEIQYEITISKKNGNTSIDMNSDNEHTTTLVVDGRAYYIMHNTEEYFTVNSDDIDSEIIVSGLNEIIDTNYTSGEEEINGKVYYYEEYEGASTFYLFVTENDENIIKTRFYFDGEDLVYIKNISTDNEIQPELIKTVLKYEAQDELFVIPE